MTTKIVGFGVDEGNEDDKRQEDGGVEFTQTRLAPVSVAMIDEAAERTLRHVRPEMAEAIRKMWAEDPDTYPATSWFAEQVELRAKARSGPLGKVALNVNEVLTPDEAQLVIEYAPEYELKFTSRVTNEHALFSARRAVDHQLLQRKIPQGETYLDFGGSVLNQVRNGLSTCVTVSPFDVDKKDAVRATMMKLALKKIANDPSHTQREQEMAISVLAGEERYHLSQRVQECSRQARFSTAVHVYDVPIEDWPKMMERCGVAIHTGCLHFSSEIMQMPYGEIPGLGSYFESDKMRDTFRMRIGKSSAEWYEHKLSDYLRYGVNQVLAGDKYVYSYEITERRQDTLFYRILRMDGTARNDFNQVYRLPGVRMVEVQGFEVFDTSVTGRAGRGLTRRTYRFPAILWERMVLFASTEILRSGAVSSEKLANYYRVLVPKQSINTVVFAGGESVPLKEIPALVSLASVVAYMDTMRQTITTRHLTAAAMERRGRADESTCYKAVMAFLATLNHIGSVAELPAGMSLDSAYDKLTWSKLVSWAPVPVFKQVDLALFVNPMRLNYKAVATPGDYGYDRKPTVFATIAEYNRMRDEEKESVAVDSVVGTSENGGSGGSDTLVADGAQVPPSEQQAVSWSVDDNGKKTKREVLPFRSVQDRVSERRLAVQEALYEAKQEVFHITDAARRVALEVLPGGRISDDALYKHAERLYNPDVWTVRQGLLVASKLAGTGAVCSHMAVYTPVPINGQYFHDVVEEVYVGESESGGKPVRRVYSRLAGAADGYSGHVMTFDPLKIFTGPPIVAALEVATTLDDAAYEFTVTTHEGPAGCGKTTAIVSLFQKGRDCVLTPTRLSAVEIRERLVAKGKAHADVATRAARTIHSYMVGMQRLKVGDAIAESGLFDEYTMMRSGMWYAAAALRSLKQVHAFGDQDQLGYVARIEVPTRHLLLVPDVRETVFETYRNPPRVLACYNHVKMNTCRTRKPDVGVVETRRSFDGIPWYGKVRLISMYQKDKKKLLEVARTVPGEVVVSTTHEAQGLECDTLVLYNSEKRARGKSKMYLYWVREYITVAVSRTTRNVIYVTESAEDDYMTGVVAYANDPVRIQCAMDWPTQGEVTKLRTTINRALGEY